MATSAPARAERLLARPARHPADDARVAGGDARLDRVSTTHAGSRDVRAVVVDEAHAFAGDDRGWHLLAVLERISRLAGRELQRIALSATVGNPDDAARLADATGCAGPRRVVNPPAAASADPEVTLDYVGSLDNAAPVISPPAPRREAAGVRRQPRPRRAARLPRCASTSVDDVRVARLARRSTSAAGPRRRSPRRATASSSPPATLELGIDVGDLDRVIQIDAPPTVASFLQRLGRTGRRPGPARNMLFLATDDDALLRAAAVLLRWGDGLRRAGRAAAAAAAPRRSAAARPRAAGRRDRTAHCGRSGSASRSCSATRRAAAAPRSSTT